MTVPSDSPPPDAVLEALLRNDFQSFLRKVFATVVPGQPFLDNWHLAALAWHLEQVRAGKIRRLLITMPPRMLKSITVSVAFPAWVLAHDPTRKFICASYSQDLAAKHARDFRAVLAALWYQRLFPRTRVSTQKDSAEEVQTTERGFRLATSVGGTLTGRGGNCLIVDDAMKPDDALSAVRRRMVWEWYCSTLVSRLDDKRTDAIIVVLQRLHAEDLAGHLIAQGGWTHLNLAAMAEVAEDIQIGAAQFHHREPGEVLHAVLEPAPVLAELKRSLGSYHFAAQYQQNPIPPDGEIIHWQWFRRYQTAPRRGPGDWILQSWDTATKADEHHDYSVCTTWLIHGSEYYLIDVYRARLEFPELKKKVIELAVKFAATHIVIEDRGSGMGLIQELRRANIVGCPRPIAFQPERDKLTRMSIQTAKIEAGHVYLPEKAPWLGELRNELLQFPNGPYDDQVDSLSQALAYVDLRKCRQAYGRDF
ncbi:MAG: phage terminase large subunit [Gammaproteobacteria bacterium]|nr:phage terminase large subunit [Gammaproteobacteria bacterium]